MTLALEAIINVNISSIVEYNFNLFKDFKYFCSSDEFSWRRATELLVEVASHGEDTGYEVPCLIVAAKDDLSSFPMAIQESTRVFTFFIDLYFKGVHNFCISNSRVCPDCLIIYANNFHFFLVLDIMNSSLLVFLKLHGVG